MLCGVTEAVFRQSPGRVRDAILGFLQGRPDGASVAEIREAVDRTIGVAVAASSVRSSLNLQARAGTLERLQRGLYRIPR